MLRIAILKGVELSVGICLCRLLSGCYCVCGENLLKAFVSGLIYALGLLDLFCS